jgi:hypothetical protein
MAELVEYLVLTECGRRFAWSALGYDQLFRDMRERNYTVTFVMPLKEYEARESELNHVA